MKNPISKKDIAIIGISGTFSESKGVMDLWDNLLKAKELIHFYSEKELAMLGVDLDGNLNRVYADATILDADKFDHSFFGFNSEEAFYMDPQIRKFFEHSWAAFEDAGYDITDINERIGVFAAASDNINWRAFTNFAQPKNINPFFLKQISNKNYINSLISYKLNLRGPSYSINTACSSSLVAVHLACRSLLLRECSMALAGASRITSTKDVGYQYEPGMIFSKDGHCKAFDADSSGTIAGEGVGAIVLKRLEDAIRDRDHIYAVIKSSSTNNDGSQKIGFTAPSVEGQYDCIRQAHQIAKIEPSSISFIEAHGTGTELGDSIEIEALNKAFGNSTNKDCAIGSIKTNIGHLDAAAGVVGIIKSALAIKYRVLPPSLHFKTPNPNINFDQGPFYVNKETKTFDTDMLLRGAVSSFGMGGTNAHAILEESPHEYEQQKEKDYELITFSAKSTKALERYSDMIVHFTEDNQDLNFANIAYTFQTGRTPFDHRGFLLYKDKKVVQSSINSIAKNTDKNLVFVFSGQGSQYFNMGKYLYETESSFRSIVDEGFALLKKETGQEWKSILFGEISSEEPSLYDTRYTQPLLFLLEYALAKTYMHWGIIPSLMIGHSLGEYTAACISGVFTFEEGVRLMLKRGSLMSKVASGTMLAVNASVEEITDFLDSTVDIAAVNTFNSCTISGDDKSLKKVKLILEKENIKCMQLDTSHAFHSQSMEIILKQYEAVFETIKLQNPQIPFVSNLTGEILNNTLAVSPQYWSSHLRNTVLFAKGLNTLFDKNSKIFIEVGPGAALIGMLKKQAKNRGFGISAYQSLKRVGQADNEDKYILNLLANLWIQGIQINWKNYYQEKKCNKVSVPTYPFEKNTFPSRVSPLERYNVTVEDGASNEIPEFSDLPISKREIATTYVAASTGIEKTLVSIWKDFFKINEVGITDSFFDLGGDSLQAVVLLNQINKEFNTKLSLENLYDTSDIQGIANLLNFTQLQNQTEDILNPNGDELVL